MEWLFDADSFVTRNHCGNWTPALIAVNQAANFLIFISYFTIPLALFGFWRTIRHRIENNWIILMFVFFILSCGMTHLMDVLAFTWVPYRLFTVIDVVTAVASVPTAFLLPGVLKNLMEEGGDAGQGKPD